MVLECGLPLRSHVLCQLRGFPACWPDRQCFCREVWAMDSQSRPFMIPPSPKSALRSVPASTLIFLNREKIDYPLPLSQYHLGSMAFHSGSPASQLFPPFFSIKKLFSIGKHGCTDRYHTGALFLAPLLKEATVILIQKHILGWLYPTPRNPEGLRKLN